jgi:hypothetical protein
MSKASVGHGVKGDFRWKSMEYLATVVEPSVAKCALWSLSVQELVPGDESYMGGHSQRVRAMRSLGST